MFLIERFRFRKHTRSDLSALHECTWLPLDHCFGLSPIADSRETAVRWNSFLQRYFRVKLQTECSVWYKITSSISKLADRALRPPAHGESSARANYCNHLAYDFG